jgi:hypothetical protein
VGRETRANPRAKEVLQNHWLGGRDSNPDTQIQSSRADQQYQRLSWAKRGQIRQNPQDSRNKELALMRPYSNDQSNSERLERLRRHFDLDFEEDTLP